jgi:hypothetical protein
MFEALSRKPLDLARIDITLVDERWVGEESDRSNAALLRSHLLQGPAAAANFVPLHIDTPTPEDGLAQVTASIAALPLPFAVVVLGMGDDGHTASFFPGGDRLAQALAPSDGQLLETIRAPAAGEPRITLTLPTSRRLRDGAGPISASSPPITTCCRRISRSSAIPSSSSAAAREAGGVAQVAGGVPAMCDGVTQGEAGMELSLFSRDVIAMSTAVALSHDMFDARVCSASATRSCRAW